MKKILLVVNDLITATNFRKDLMHSLNTLGHEVVVVSPSQSIFLDAAKILTDAENLSFRHINLPLNRLSLNPFSALKYILSLRSILKLERPDIILLYTPIVVIFGSIAGKLAGIKKIYSTITGLGYAFASNNLKAKILSWVLKILYKFSLSFNINIFFQNTDDKNYFLDHALVAQNKSLLINGSGVNMDEFKPSKKDDARYIFLMISRIIPEKGVREFIEAAKMVKEQYPKIIFQLLGALEDNSPSIAPEEVESWQSDGIIEYISGKSDVRPFIANANIYVLPSYREGTPKSVLEAMAMGKPIITSDAPGCRETVIDGVNGYLVQPRNSILLAKAMLSIFEDEEFCKSAGIESLKIIQEKYDVKKVNKFFLEAIEIST